MIKLTKKHWMVIAGSALLLAIAGVVIYKKRKNAAAMALAGSSAETGAGTTAGTTTGTTAGTTSPATPGGAGLPAGMGTFKRVTKDTTKGTAILLVDQKGKFKVGDTVTVAGNVYKGTAKVWYLYTKGADWDNVYIDMPYISDDSGTVTK
jgi:LPXTG-motif cell wall-anchored protein